MVQLASSWGKLFFVSLYCLSSCAYRVHFVYITPVFSAHTTAKLQLKLFRLSKKKACISAFSRNTGFCVLAGAEGLEPGATLFLTFANLPYLAINSQLAIIYNI